MKNAKIMTTKNKIITLVLVIALALAVVAGAATATYAWYINRRDIDEMHEVTAKDALVLMFDTEITQLGTAGTLYPAKAETGSVANGNIVESEAAGTVSFETYFTFYTGNTVAATESVNIANTFKAKIKGQGSTGRDLVANGEIGITAEFSLTKGGAVTDTMTGTGGTITIAPDTNIFVKLTIYLTTVDELTAPDLKNTEITLTYTIETAYTAPATP